MKYLKQYATEALFTADTKEDVQVSHIVETGRVDYQVKQLQKFKITVRAGGDMIQMGYGINGEYYEIPEFRTYEVEVTEGDIVNLQITTSAAGQYSYFYSAYCYPSVPEFNWPNQYTITLTDWEATQDLNIDADSETQFPEEGI